MGAFIFTNKENKEVINVDLLDLLDSKTRVPKDLKAPNRKVVTLLDVMDLPVASSENDASIDLVNLLDSKTRVPKDIKAPKHKAVTLLDVMDPPVTNEVKTMDLADFLDSKTRLPKKEEGDETFQRRNGILDVMDPPESVGTDKADEVDLTKLLDSKTRLPRDRIPAERRKSSLVDIIESGEKR
ncbi:MAG: hypothetical protein SGILL_001580 [Bacillariaceae sp.]